VLKGHTSHIKELDFSRDSKFIKASDTSRDLLYWSVETFKKVSNLSLVKSVQWATFTCQYGWGLQGIHNTATLNNGDQDVSCIARAEDKSILCVALNSQNSTGLKVFRYPCLGDAVPDVYPAHSSPVTDMVFTKSNKLITAGGNDCTIIVWDIIQNVL
jgi:echinoderm microtubule-associated protein-like 1/2